MSLVGTIAGSAAAKKLAPALIRIGAPILADVVSRNAGPGAGKVVEKLAEALGVPPTPEAVTEVIEREPEATAPIVRDVEKADPGLWEYLRSADAGRLTIFAQEAAEPWWAWAWRPFWMWLLAAFWVWRIIVVAVLGIDGQITIADLITLTLIIAGFYMGGHTLKDLGAKAVEAVRGKG